MHEPYQSDMNTRPVLAIFGFNAVKLIGNIRKESWHEAGEAREYGTVTGRKPIGNCPLCIRFRQGNWGLRGQPAFVEFVLRSGMPQATMWVTMVNKVFLLWRHRHDPEAWNAHISAGSGGLFSKKNDTSKPAD